MIKFISSAQAGSTQGDVYELFHTACALAKLLPGFHEKVDLCSNDMRKLFEKTAWKQRSTWLWWISVNYMLGSSQLRQSLSDKLPYVSRRSCRGDKALLRASFLPGKTMPQISSLTFIFCPILNITCIHISKYHLGLPYQTICNYFWIGWMNDDRFEEKVTQIQMEHPKNPKPTSPNPPQTTKRANSVPFFPPVTFICCSCSGCDNIVIFSAQLSSHMRLRQNTYILQYSAELKDFERFIHFYYDKRSVSSNSIVEDPKL